MNIEQFRRQVVVLRGRTEKLFAHSMARGEAVPDERDVRLAELETAVEELSVAEEELQHQADELRASADLLDSERRRYEDLFNFAPDAYVVTDSQGVIRAANRAAGMQFDVPVERLVGKPLAVYVHPDDLGDFRSGLNNLERWKGELTWQMRMCPRGCPCFHASVRIAADLPDATQPPKIRWLIRDVTDRVKIEAEIRQLNAELEQRVQERTAELEAANQALHQEVDQRTRAQEELARHRDQLEQLVAERTEALRESLEMLRRTERLASIGTLAAGIAHEINNPLNSILMSARAAQHLRDPAEIDAILKLIAEQATRGGRIVHSVLKFSRAAPVQKQPRDLNTLMRRVNRVVATNLPTDLASRCQIKLNLADSLPVVEFNDVELEQVLMNLIENAAVAADGPVVITLTTSFDPARGVCLTVADNGPGIPAHELLRIFDPFFTGRPSRGGTGLGLSICHSIIAEHDGSITAHSQPGQGTIFTIVFPPAEQAPVNAA